MPEQVKQTDRPEQGFVGLGQYLDANKGTLDAQFGKDTSEAQQFSGYNDLYRAAENMGRASGTNPDPTTVPGYSDAMDKAGKAQGRAPSPAPGVSARRCRMRPRSTRA